MTHDLPDYYTVLGVASTASSAEIAHAYRTRIRSRHPDARPDTDQDAAAEGLSELIAAYAVLRDPDRRADYDQKRPSTTSISPPLAASSRMPLLRVGPVRYHGPAHRGHE
ncbi:DnaJ domain-containing protein [Kutzneria sp. NPDC052558]|uniref:DnaJ domain-containing protein n=1 Tax=Kutzneria sp. NPDC052558 TaxID=3364121 RepID=UPI0037C7A3CD